MKLIFSRLSVFIFLFLSCGNVPVSEKINSAVEVQVDKSLINPEGKTLDTRFLLPDGFQRTEDDSTSFGYYLRKLPLKSDGSKVKLYNGDEKNAEGVYDAVVDLPIGNKDLHQCRSEERRVGKECRL